MALSLVSRPRLASKARLRWDRREGKHMLLYPERGLLLNATAADIVQLCTGGHTVEEIVDSLAAKYPAQSREAVEREALTFLVEIHARGLLEVATEAPGEGSTPSVADRGGRKPWEG